MVLSGTLSWVTVRRSCGKGEALRVQKGTPEMPLENSQTFGGHLEGTGFLPDKVGVEPEQYFCMNVDFFFFRVLFEKVCYMYRNIEKMVQRSHIPPSPCPPGMNNVTVV